MLGVIRHKILSQVSSLIPIPYDLFYFICRVFALPSLQSDTCLLQLKRFVLILGLNVEILINCEEY